MNNPHQYNYAQQLEHRLRMVQDDLNMLKAFIKQQDLNIIFNNVNSKLTGEPGVCNINNIEIACDLNDDQSLSWGMFQ